MSQPYGVTIDEVEHRRGYDDGRPHRRDEGGPLRSGGLQRDVARSLTLYLSTGFRLSLRTIPS